MSYTSLETYDTSTPENKGRFPLLLKVATGAFALVAGASLALSLREVSRMSAQENRLKEGIPPAAEADGFDLDQIHWAQGDSTLIDINLGSCSLRQVKVDVVKDSDSTVQDLTNYRFSGHAFARQYSQRQGRRIVTVTDGQPVDFHFENIDELQANILGDNPCRTIASNTLTK